ncbi:MAG: tripartite tricarboxylate transporter TctB family protein [Pseudomonadota bacterium]
MKVNDLILAALVILGAVALATVSLTLPPIPGQAYGADVFPMAIAVGLLLCGWVLAARSVKAGAGRAVTLTWFKEPGAPTRVLGTLALVALYIWLSPLLGFVLASVLMLMGLFALLRVKITLALPSAVISALALYYVFAYGLRVPLPRGLIEGWI